MDQSRDQDESGTGTEEEQSDDLRSLLEDAIDGEEVSDSDTGAGSGDSDSGEATESETGGEEAAAGDAGGESAAAAPAGDNELSAPVDWDAALRENWKDLPKPVQEKIAAREQHIAQAMQGTAQARRIAQDFTSVANQYGSVMAAEGVQNPVQMFDTVMKTISELRMGSPGQRAARMADLIQTYGVEVGALDDALAARLGGSQEGGAEQTGYNPQLEQMIDQRMQPVNQMMQQLAEMQQQKQYAGQQEAAQTVEQFAATPEGELLQDVRHDMADLIDLATRQGREMSIQEAYGKACAMNPTINQVLTQRAEQKRLAEAGQGLAQKKAAGSSIRPRNLAGGKPETSGNLYDDLSAAWDDQIGR